MNVLRASTLLIIFFLSACSEQKFIEGSVVDYQTGASLEGVTVRARQTGWDFSRFPAVVWDRTYDFEELTDKNGKFHIVYDVGTSAHLWAEKEGYVRFIAWYPENTSITIKLKAKDPNYVRLDEQLIEIGMKNFKPYGWVFDEKRITFDEGEADLFPEFSTTQEFLKFDFTVGAPGGIVFISGKELGVESNWMVYADTAPDSGYGSSVRLIAKSNDPGGIYFVRTRDGNHYAKFDFDPQSFGVQGSEKNFKNGTWALLLTAIYNDDGSTNLRFER